MPRLYAPIRSRDVMRLAHEGECYIEALFAVTTALREQLPSADEEEREYLATQLAASASTADPVAVAAFEIDEALYHRDEHGVLGAVTMDSPLRRRDLVCFLVADPGQRVEEDADLELSWYDATEIDAVQALLSA